MKKRLIALCLALAFVLAALPGNLVSLAADGVTDTQETVTVTVNYVYASNQSMVTQPYSAQIAKGAAFDRTIAVPQILNYSVPTTSAAVTESVEDQVSFTTETGAVSEVESITAVDFNIVAVTEDVTVTLYYYPGTATYTVNHYYQNLENDEYTLVNSGTVTGDIDAYTSAVAESKQGFICTGVPEVIIAADGTSVVDIYYDRLYYTVVFDVNGGLNGPAPVYDKYGTVIDTDSIQEPTRAGYTFAGWNPVIAQDAKLTITADVTYVAQWIPKTTTADYTIVIWGQNANDDEYSYLSSHEAFGMPGDTVSWNPDNLICEGSHVHSAKCYEMNCGKAEHNHVTAGCVASCGQISHTHGTGCYAGVGEATSHIAAPWNPVNGQIYAWDLGFLGSGKSIYINGTWYKYSGSLGGNQVASATCGKTEGAHTHSDTCYGCGLTNHTHSELGGDCYKQVCEITNDHTNHTSDHYMSSLHPGEALWLYERSEEVVIDADGTTVLNVYFTRKEFTLTFNYNYSYNGGYASTDTITARWGEDIDSEYKAIIAKTQSQSTFWSSESDGDEPYTNYVGVMPKENRTYYNRGKTGSSGTMTYYGEDLNGGYVEIFSVSGVGGFSVTKEDFYEFDGYVFNDGKSSDIRDSCSGAEFYYDRKELTLSFYSASNSTTDRSSTIPWGKPLGNYDYTPTNKPDTVEKDAIFMGWYLNPECTGEEYSLSEHTMPKSNLALYAKWVNGLYTVETFTDDSMTTPYTYEGYTGKEENIIKYTLATEVTDPQKDGYVFVGWFYNDGNGEQPFSFTMPITRDYKLYPKFSNKAMVNYTVHYYLEGTTTKVADDRKGTAMIGSNVTEMAKMGTDLNLVGDNYNSYFPDKTSTSVVLNQEDIEIIFYYKEAVDVEYTVKYVDSNGQNLLDPVKKTVKYSVVTEYYEPIDGYTPRQFRIEKELSWNNPDQNVIVFVYDKSVTELTIGKVAEGAADDEKFIFVVEGVAGTETAGFKMTVALAAGKRVTIADLPVGGQYTVTETKWSWRYQPAGGEYTKSVTLDVSGNVVEFTNTQTNDKWLDGNDSVVNVFNGQLPEASN